MINLSKIEVGDRIRWNSGRIEEVHRITTDVLGLPVVHFNYGQFVKEGAVSLLLAKVKRGGKWVDLQ